MNNRARDITLPYPDPADGRMLLRPGANEVAQEEWAKVCAFMMNLPPAPARNPYAKIEAGPLRSYVEILTEAGDLALAEEPKPEPKPEEPKAESPPPLVYEAPRKRGRR